MSNNKVTILIGADPELFLKEKKTGKFVSAHNLLPGTKWDPHKVDYGAVQVDGVAAEFNIDPTSSAQEFIDKNNVLMAKIQSMVGENYGLCTEPVAIFDPEYFDKLPTDTKTLGCNPDFNAWTHTMNPTPDGNNTTMRTAAGHVHIGWTKNANPVDQTHIDDCEIIVRDLDYYLGMYSLLWDQDNRRRQLYGKAGAYRAKPYGVEYRPLSNVWLSDPVLMKFVWQAAFQCVYSAMNTTELLADKFGNAAQYIIDNNIKWWDKPSFYKLCETVPELKNKEKLSSLSNFTGLPSPFGYPKNKLTKPKKASGLKEEIFYAEWDSLSPEDKKKYTTHINSGAPGFSIRLKKEYIQQEQEEVA